MSCQPLKWNSPRKCHSPFGMMFNSLWPINTIWRHRFGSTLAQVMACCLMTPLTKPLPEPMLNNDQWGPVTLNVNEGSYTKILKILNLDVSLRTANLRLQSHLPGINELTHCGPVMPAWCQYIVCSSLVVTQVIHVLWWRTGTAPVELFYMNFNELIQRFKYFHEPGKSILKQHQMPEYIDNFI